MTSKERKQVVNEIHAPARKNYPRRRTIIKGLFDLWQMDLAEMRQYSQQNKGYKMILVCIDCFSKFLWTRPLKSKTGDEITKRFAEILADVKKSPKNLQTDQGTEFFNRKFQNLMNKYNINHYNTYSIKKAAIAERVIRTLKSKLYKYFSLYGTYKWIDVLPQFTKEYNDSKHSKIGYKPSEVNKSNEKKILLQSYSHLKIAGSRKFNVGDIVRISKSKHIFEKGYTPNWTTELFKIITVKITNPTTYLLEDMQGSQIKGAFYTEELQKATYSDVYLVEKVLRRKGNLMFVKWLGLDKKHNSWIKNTDLI